MKQVYSKLMIVRSKALLRCNFFCRGNAVFVTIRVGDVQAKLLKSSVLSANE